MPLKGLELLGQVCKSVSDACPRPTTHLRAAEEAQRADALAGPTGRVPRLDDEAAVGGPAPAFYDNPYRLC